MPELIEVLCDADLAGWRRNAKCTACIVKPLNGHHMDEFSVTQLYAAVKVSIEGFYCRNNSRAAVAALRRLVTGNRLRHVHSQNLFVQQLEKEKVLSRSDQRRDKHERGGYATSGWQSIASTHR